MNKPNVLFLCTHNSARSQMAEALLRHYAGDRFNALSAGLEPSAVNPLVPRVMAELGIDTAGQRSKGVGEYLGRIAVHHLIIVCARAEQACPTTFPGVLNRFFWPFDDPAAVEGSEAQQLAAFRQVRDQIARRLEQWLKTMEAAVAPESPTA